jgi:excisionase family DNA binding protein
MSIDEVMALWKCHHVTVLRLMKRGTLHYTEVGGELRFDRNEVMHLKNKRIARYPHLTVRK